MAILETKDLRKIYGSGENEVHALDGVSISVEEGEFVAVIGTSGSGKSTLLNMIGGLDRPTSGSVTIRGKELLKMKDEELTIFRRRNIGFVFQNYNLVSTLSVRENIMLPLLLDGMRVDQKFLKEITESLKMTEKPAVILADEPTGNLDSVTGMEVVGLLKTSAERYHQTILLVTHNEEIAQMAERIIRIEDGKVTGDSDEK